MLTDGGTTTVLAMSGIQAGWTGGMIALIVVGLLLLGAGLQIVRGYFTLLFTGVGAWIGLAVAGQFENPGSWLPWACGVGGAVVVGLAGFALYRLWLILLFGAVLAWVAAAAFLQSTGDTDLRDLNRQVVTAARETYVAFLKGENRVDTEKSEVSATPEQVQRMLVLRGAMDQYRRVAAKHGIGMSLAAIGGLAGGLLIGGYLFRLAAVLLTSLWGLKITLVGLLGLLLLYWPGAVDRMSAMGWKALCGPAGLWLLGIWCQGALMRRRKRPPAEAKDADEPPAVAAKS